MRKLAFLFACLWIAVPCGARTITVDPNGFADFTTIQAAIDDSNNGDTILVAAGTYYENIRIAWKDDITVQGSGAEVTTINGGGNGHVVWFNNLASGTVSDFTITNSGDDPLFSAAVFTSQCSVTIADNIIVNNANGISISSNSNAVVTGNRIINNTSIFGEGIRVSSSFATITCNIIANNNTNGGIYCWNSSPSIINNTIVNNHNYGIRCNPTSTQTISNNIITHNEWGLMAMGGDGSPVPLLDISYNNVWNNTEANYWYEWATVCIPEDPCCQPGGASEPFEPQPGTGEISQDPLFVDAAGGDYHLQSEAGRWNPNSESWVVDASTSPCIDAGNPGCPLGDEPVDGNNVRINMGAYGRTVEASKTPVDWYSIADLTNDFIVDFSDLGAFVGYWLESGQCIPSDLNRNGSVDLNDFVIFGNNWE